MLLAHPSREGHVVLVPAQRAREQLALEPRHAGVQALAELGVALRAFVGAVLRERGLERLARALELRARRGPLELQGKRDRVRHGGLLQGRGAVAAARCAIARWKSAAAISAVRSHGARIQLGRCGQGP